MKKLIFTFIALFTMACGANATVIWEGSCTIGNWSGSSVTIDKESFASVAAGNIIKVTISAYAETESDNPTAVTYWQYNLGQKDNGWTELTGFSGSNLTKGQANVSYTLTETNATELKDYGLSVNGRYITVTKVELLTTTSESIWTGSTETGNWETNVTLTYDYKGNLTNAQMNDYIIMTYTVTASGAQAAIQNSSWSSIVGKDDDSYVAEGDNTGKTLTLTIDDAATLEDIQHNGVLLRGKYITITSLDLVKPSNRYDAVPLTIGSDGICTYGSSKNLDFSSISDVTPYYVSAVTTGTVTLKSVETTRAWAGYIVQGTAGTYNIPVAASEPEWVDAFNNLRYTGDYDGNWVYRSAYSEYSDGNSSNDEETSTDEYKIKNYYRYIFAKNGSDIGFYKLATDYSRTVDANIVYYHVLNAHKAYLESTSDIQPTAGAPILLLFEGSNTTAINAIQERTKENGIYYNLSGQRVLNPTRGLYIVNGKKYIKH